MASNTAHVAIAAEEITLLPEFITAWPNRQGHGSQGSDTSGRKPLTIQHPPNGNQTCVRASAHRPEADGEATHPLDSPPLPPSDQTTPAHRSHTSRRPTELRRPTSSRSTHNRASDPNTAPSTPTRTQTSKFGTRATSTPITRRPPTATVINANRPNSRNATTNGAHRNNINNRFRSFHR